MHGNGEMTAIGYAIGAILLVIVVPLLPVLVVLYLFAWLVERTRPTGSDSQSSTG